MFEAREKQRQGSGGRGPGKRSRFSDDRVYSAEQGVKVKEEEARDGGWESPSAEAVSEAKLKETHPMVLARWKTAA